MLAAVVIGIAWGADSIRNSTRFVPTELRLRRATVQIAGETYRRKDKRRAGILARPQVPSTAATKSKVTIEEKV